MMVVFEFPPKESCTQKFAPNFLINLRLNLTFFQNRERNYEILPEEGRWALNPDMGRDVVSHLPRRRESWWLICKDNVQVNFLHYESFSSYKWRIDNQIICSDVNCLPLTYLQHETYPRVDRDLLMLAASFSRSPSAPEVFCLQYEFPIRDWVGASWIHGLW